MTNLVDGGACFTICLPTFDATQSQNQVFESTDQAIASTDQAIAPTHQAIAPAQIAQPQQNYADTAGS